MHCADLSAYRFTEGRLTLLLFGVMLICVCLCLLLNTTPLPFIKFLDLGPILYLYSVLLISLFL